MKTVYGRRLKLLKSSQVVNQYQYFFFSDCSPLKLFVSSHLADMGVILYCDTKEMRVVEDSQEKWVTQREGSCKLEELE